MGKLLDDGNTLYKKQRLQESTQRFQYALKKFPPVEDYGGAEYQSAFQHLRIHLTLNLARCKRKMGVRLTRERRMLKLKLHNIFFFGTKRIPMKPSPLRRKC
jgi:hypothetical protein